MSNIANVIYIPYDKNNEQLYEARKKLAQEFIEQGWKLLTTLPMKCGNEKEPTTFWCLVREDS